MNWWYYEIFYVGKVSQMDVNFKILGSLSSSFFCLLTKRVVSALELNQQESLFMQTMEKYEPEVRKR